MKSLCWSSSDSATASNFNKGDASFTCKNYVCANMKPAVKTLVLYLKDALVYSVPANILNGP